MPIGPGDNHSVRGDYKRMMSDDYLIEIKRWRDELDESLRDENSWLALAGLVWLEKPSTRIGSEPDSDIHLKGVASWVGEILLQDNRVELALPSGSALRVNGVAQEHMRLKPDTSGNPDLLTVGPYSMILIERGGRLGIRVWDNDRTERTSFPGRQWYPIDPALRLMATYTPYIPEKVLSIPNELGDIEQELSPGCLSFELDGVKLRLDSLDRADGGLFLMFKDSSSGRTSYGSGRFLTTPAPQDGQVELDFNRAYNPPCAFTRYATCPLPPKENVLPHAILAGEKMPLLS